MKKVSQSQKVYNIALFALSLLSILTLFFCYPTVFARQTDTPAKLDITVVIDAGHGGIDGGVTANGAKESDLNLAYALSLATKLETYGIKAVLTRTDQGGLYGLPTRGFKRRDMAKRRDIIRECSPDMVVSIHMNRYSSSARKGPQVFFQSKDKVSNTLASIMQRRLNQYTGNAHSCIAGDFFICKCLDGIPSVIVECGFLSNAEEAKRLSDGHYREQLVDVLAKAIVEYLFSY